MNTFVMVILGILLVFGTGAGLFMAHYLYTSFKYRKKVTKDQGRLKILPHEDLLTDNEADFSDRTRAA